MMPKKVNKFAPKVTLCAVFMRERQFAQLSHVLCISINARSTSCTTMSTTPPNPSPSHATRSSQRAHIETSGADWLSALISIGTVLQAAANSTHMPVASTVMSILQYIDVRWS